jgi:large subunit ribosomal protein L25
MKGLIKLRLDGKEYQAMVREIQRDPIKDRFMHIDFMAVQMNQPVDAEVPLHLHGEPVGVKAGGVLQQPLRTVHVRCLPSDIPQDLSLDITNLEVGDSLTLAAVQLPKGVELLSDLETVVASIVPPQAGGDEEPAVEEGAETDEES